MAEALPEKLKWMAREGPAAFWRIEDPESSEEIAGLVNVTPDEVDDLWADAIQARRGILIANALLLAQSEGVEGLRERGDTRWDNLMDARFDYKDEPEVHKRIGEALRLAFSGFEEGNRASATLYQRLPVAHETLRENGLEWNKEEQRAKVLRVTGLEQGNRPKEILSDVSAALAGEWHDGGSVKVPKKLVDRVSRVLGWFFQPSLLGSIEQRIRNNM